MFYLPLIIVAAFATAGLSKRSPRTVTVIGVTALGAAVVAVAIAEVTGNLLLFYLGALAMPFGLMVLIFRVIGVLRQRQPSGP
jgi:hypothetical protein